MASFKQIVPTPRGKGPNQAQARVRLRAWQIVLICLLGAAGLLGTVSLVRAAVGISATKTFAFIGGDGDGKADSGETIEYTVQIANSNVIDAAGVVFSDTVDANTTLVGSSVNVSPLALDDTYATIGNTLLEVGVAAGPAPAVHVAGGLFANDREFLGEAGLFTIASHTSPAHGTLPAFNSASGTFSYLPNAGYTGADSFSYTLTDAGGLSSTATVTINVNAAQVWYVKNDAPAGGLGRSTDPFDTLAEASSASAANDTIYVFAGNGTSAGQSAGIVLKDGQRLLGEGVALTVPVSMNGGASPTTLRPAGGQPRIAASAGSGVAATNDIPAEIRGLGLSGSANAIDITIADASGGALTIGDNTIDGAGAEGIDINKAGAGTLTLDVQNNTWNAAGTHAGNAFDARATAGALDLNFSNNSAILSAASGVLLDGSGATLTVTGFANNDVSGNTGGTGISATSLKFDATPGGVFQQVAAGAITIGESGNGVGAAGMLLSNVSGDLAFADLDIYANNGAGLQASSAAAYTGSAGLQLAADTGTSSILSLGGPAVDLNTVTAALLFQSIGVTNSATTGVSLASVSGSFSADAGSSIANSIGTDFAISGGSATVIYDGTIIDDLGALVTIANTTGGAKTFTGAITDGNDGDGSGVSLTNNTGATISFMGGLVLATGANPAFTATGGGTVSVCDENPCSAAATGALVNSLKTTTSTALNVVSTTIGANNLEFKSISANGAANGIVLSNTGSSGGLVVKGDSGSSNNSSGGLIQNTTGHGISLASTRNVALDQVTIQTTGGSGINGAGVTNFSFTNGTIAGSGDALGESNIAFNGSGSLTGDNLDGTLTVTGSTLSNAFEHGIHAESDAGTLSNAIIQNNTISSSTSTASSKGAGIQLIGTGNSATAASLTKATISGNTISNFPSGAGIQVSYGNASASGPGGGAGVPSSANVVAISNNTLNGGATKFGTSAILFVLGGGNAGSRSQGNLAITANNAQNSLGTTIGVGNNGSADLTGLIDSNVVVANNTLGSQGIGGGNGVSTGGSSATPHLVLSVTNNTISQTDGNGILLVGRGTSGLAELGIRNNTVAAPLTGVRPGIRVDAGNTSSLDDAICLDISGNSSAGSGGSQGIGLRKQGTSSTTNDFGIEGMAATGSPGVETYVNGLNPAGNSTLLISATSGFASCNTTALVPNGGPVLAQQSDSSAAGMSLASAGFEPAAISAAYANPASFKPTSYTWAKTDAGASVATVDDSAHSAPALAPATAPVAASSPLNITIGSLPAGKQITIRFRVTVNDPTTLGATQLANQGQVTGSNISSVLTDDPTVVGGSNPTATQIDRPDTAVVSLDRASASPTKNASVTWQVVFADPVDGLSSSNFSLVSTGLGGSPVITGVTEASGPPATTWNVTASTGTGEGTLGLNFTGDAGLSHDVTNASFAGQDFAVDHVAPTVQSFARYDPATSPTSADTLTFEVLLSEKVFGIGNADFAVSGTSTAGIQDVAIINSTGLYRVTIAGGDLASYDGVVGLNFSGAASMTDEAGNALVASEPATDETYIVDNAAPSVTIEQAAGQADPTNAGPIEFTVEFSEPVSGFATGDVIVSGAFGSLAGAVSEIAPNDGTTYTVAVSSMSGTGEVVATIGSGVAEDLAGQPNSASSSADNTVTYDDVPPVTDIDSQPADPSASADASFSFRGDDGGNVGVRGYECKLDAGAFAACSSAKSYTGLADGSHTFAVRTIDNAGNADASPASYTWLVDAIAPDTSIDSQPADPSASADASFGFSGDDGSGTGVSGYECKLDAGAFAACSSPQSYTGLADGSHTFAVRALDGAGNADASPASYTWVVDTAAPDTSIDSQPADPTNSTSASLGFGGDDSGGTGVSGYECKLDAGAFAACSSPQSYTSLADGSHTFAVRALDTLGNADASPASYTWVVDTAAPDTSIDSQPTDPTNSTGASLGFGGDDGSGTGVSGYECKLDAGAFAACSSAKSYTGLADGSHTFAVRALDGAGNADASPATYTWVVDTAAPDTSIDSQPADPTNSTGASLGFGGDDGSGTGVSGYECKLDAGAFAACSSPQSYTGLADGSHTFAVRALDGAGNVDASPASYTWVVDTAAPTAVISSAVVGATNSSPIPVTITFDEGVGGFGSLAATGDLVVTNGTASDLIVGSGGDSVYTFTITPAGQGAVTVELASGSVYDQAGNANSAPSNTLSVTYDTVAPNVAVEQAAGQADPAGAAPIEFEVTFDEPVASFAAADLTLGGSAPGTLSASISGGPSAYTVAVSGMTGGGTVTAAVAAGAVSDPAGNSNAASSSTDNQVTFDPVVPIVTGIVRADPSPTAAATVAFTVTFSKDVTGVDAGDFGLATSGLTGAAVTNVAGSGTTWSVTVGTGAGDGTLRLDLLDDDSIADGASHALGGKGLGNGGFSAGEVYTLDRTAPVAGSLVAPNITAAGGAGQSFTVVLSDNLSIDIASLGGDDIRVVGPNGFSQLAAFVGVSPATNGSPRTATYVITAPGGTWDAADKGVYRVELQAGQVCDITGNAAAAVALGTFRVDTEPPIRRVYLPMVERPGTPDLVASLSVSPDRRSFRAGEPVMLSVTVTNLGDGVAGAFWVDLYINPSSPPTAANQVWNTRCALSPCFGIAWQVLAGLAPGQSITLSSQNLPAGYSVWPGWFAAGTTDLYAYADSFNPGVAAGAVAERDERNNRAELHGLSVTGPNPRLMRPAGQVRVR